MSPAPRPGYFWHAEQNVDVRPATLRAFSAPPQPGHFSPARPYTLKLHWKEPSTPSAVR